MKTMTYKNHTIIRTNTDTTITREAFGAYYQAIVPLYAVEGQFEKGAGPRPFLTSVAQAKEWINEQIEEAEE